MNATHTSSTRPYLIRAIYEWCTDNGLTPYVAIAVDGSVQVPLEFVRDHEIVLNISFDATGDLILGNEFIEFKARFSGIPREIMVPIERVTAIYAKENGQGMSFPLVVAKGGPATLTSIGNAEASRVESKSPGRSSGTKSGTLAAVKRVDLSSAVTDEPPEPQSPKSGPKLKRVK